MPVQLWPGEHAYVAIILCNMMRCAQLDAHTFATQGRPGVEAGPNALVEAGLLDQLKELEWTVEFTGHQQFEEIADKELLANDTPIGNMKNPRTVSAVTRRVAEVVAKEAQAGKIPLTLGGDHSLVSWLDGVFW